MSRTLRSREPITTAPSHVSQLNCMPILGIDARRYLEFIREYEVPHACVGKLRVAELHVLRDRLRQLATSTTLDVADDLDVQGIEPCNEDDQPETVDAVLAKLGRRSTE